MSLTSDIATLVARYEALATLFDGKKAGIEAAVAAAILAVPSPARTVYIHAANGDDAADGLTSATPVRTMSRVRALIANSRNAEIYLMSDVTIDNLAFTLQPGHNVYITSHGAVDGDIKRKILLTLQANSVLSSGDWVVAGFRLPRFGIVGLAFDSVEIVFPAAPSTGTMVDDAYNGLVAGALARGPSFIGVEINYSKITRPAGSVGVLAGARTRALSLLVKGSTYTTADMAGKWVAGVASGAAPSGLITSNLATL